MYSTKDLFCDRQVGRLRATIEQTAGQQDELQNDLLAALLSLQLHPSMLASFQMTSVRVQAVKAPCDVVLPLRGRHVTGRASGEATSGSDGVSGSWMSNPRVSSCIKYSECGEEGTTNMW